MNNSSNINNFFQVELMALFNTSMVPITEDKHSFYANASRNCSLRLFRAPPDKQIFIKTFIVRFLKWGEWQRKIVLCGLTERCSKELLKVLMTALLPVFHQSYKVSSLKHKGRISVTGQQELQNKVEIFETDPLNKDSQLTTTLASHLNELSKSPVVTERANGSGFKDIAEEDVESANIYDANKILDSDKAIAEGHCLDQTKDVNSYFENVGTVRDIGEVLDAHKRETSLEEEIGELDSNRIAAVGENAKPCDISAMIETNRPCSTQSNESVTKNIPLHRSQSSSTTPDIVLRAKIESSRPHSHRIPRTDSLVSSGQLLPPINRKRLDKLGPYMLSGNKGAANVLTAKNLKWWLPSAEISNLIRPSKSKLLESFKSDINEFWKNFPLWTNAEKGDCILEICSQCSLEELTYFGECVRQRLKERFDVQRLSDNILLGIFLNLKDNDLVAAKQVCKRWLRIIEEVIVAKKQCYKLAEDLGISIYLKEELKHGNWLEKTWKDIYKDLLDISKNSDMLHKILNCDTLGNYNNQLVNRLFNNLESTVQSHSENQINDASSVVVDQLGVYDGKQEGSVAARMLSNSKSGVIVAASRKEIPIDRSNSNMNQFVGGTLALLEDNLKKVTSSASDLDNNDVALDIRSQPVQARNELTSADRKSTGNNSSDLSTVTVPGVKSLKRVRKLKGHFEGVMALYSDAKRVITGSGDRSIRVWDVRSGRKIQRLEGHKGGIRAVIFDKNSIYTGSWDMTIMVWDIVKFALVDTLFSHTGCVSSLELSDTFLISGSHDMSILIWDKETRKTVKSLYGHEGAVTCLQFHDDENLFSGGADSTIRLWNIGTGECRRIFHGNGESLLTVKVCGQLIASGCSDGKVKFWDKSTGSCEAAIQAHKGATHGLSFVGTRFITAGEDHTIKEWDLSTCACLRTLSGHKGAVYCIRASKKRIISGSADNTTRIWDLDNFVQQIGGPYDQVNKNSFNARIIESRP